MVHAETNREKDEAVRELLLFVGDFSRLIDRQVSDTRAIMVKTVDEMMASVNQINSAADFKLKKADELLVKDKGANAFESKSVRDVDTRHTETAQRIKAINETISTHMSGLGHLDDSVRSVLFSIMGALSVDDVVRQRLEHVTASAHAMDDGIKLIVQEFAKGTLSVATANTVKNQLAQKMYKSFTMEGEKAVFKRVLGDIKSYQ